MNSSEHLWIGDHLELYRPGPNNENPLLEGPLSWIRPDQPEIHTRGQMLSYGQEMIMPDYFGVPGQPIYDAKDLQQRFKEYCIILAAASYQTIAQRIVQQTEHGGSSARNVFSL
jgi:hypothetical protein